jgi:alginate O-acetyltransferase complex protein AlgJ
MPKGIVRAIGTLKPWKPKKSLPSYSEPTPETTRKLTREQEAELALNRTVFTGATPQVLIALFVATIAAVPIVQFATGRSALRVLTFHGMPTAKDLKAAEKSIEAESVVSQWLLPRVQSWLTGNLGAGNEQVYLGRDGWLFYRPDVDYVIGAPFLAPARLKQRAHAAAIQPDPVQAIVQFRDQLAARGIDLIVVPAPTKASIQPERLSARAGRGVLLQNDSFAEFAARLTAAGVRMFDPAPLLMQQKATAPDGELYLRTDTHWRPEAVEFVAQQLATSLHLPPLSSPAAPLNVLAQQITGQGDIARMLKLQQLDRSYPPQPVTIRQVNAGTALWRPAADADVLLLGDSFANIFSLEALGWGESAGLAEQLSVALGGRPLDCILRNSDAAFATREMLANELARGRDRLAGKKLVIWEFAARELAFGNWKLLDVKLGTPAPAHFFNPAPGTQTEVSGTAESVSAAPRPGSVPYADHVIALHLVDITGTSGAGAEAVVYLQSMRDNVWTPAAHLRPGEHVKLRLRAWSDVAAQYESINRSELDDPALQLEQPVWGELVN